MYSLVTLNTACRRITWQRYVLVRKLHIEIFIVCHKGVYESSNEIPRVSYTLLRNDLNRRWFSLVLQYNQVNNIPP